MDAFIPDLFAKASDASRGPAALGATRAQVEAWAASAACQLGYLRQATFAEMGQLVGRAGGSITSQSASLGGEDLSLEAAGGRFTIHVQEHTHPRRDRFDVAHALGHWTLHYLIPNQRGNASISWLRVPRYLSDQSNHEANWFAFAFLMPEGEVRERAAADPADPMLTVRIAEEFQVSPRHADIRLRSLGLLD